MKKMMAMAMAATMVMAAAVPAMADEKSMTVTYGVDAGYVLTIPSDVTFTKSALTGSGDVKVTEALLAADETLTVTIKSTNGYNLVYDTDSKIVYTVTPAGGQAFSGTDAQVVMEVEAGTKEKTVALAFATTENAIAAATKSGDHEDTLTFTGSIA